MSTMTLTSWLLTYLVHSTVLLGTVWLVCRVLGDTRFALQEILLRFAFIGGLLTATLQVGFGIEPLGGTVDVDRLTAGNTIAASALSLESSTVTGAETAASETGAPGGTGISWSVFILALWAAGSSLALSVLVRSVNDLRRLLETRRLRPPGRLIERLAETMGLRRPVRVSTSPAIAVPFATGIRRPEICCPERVADLAYEHRRNLFAHELAHLARLDPAWQLLYRLAEAALFLQPLNRVVRRRLEELAEHLTDERAVACTGDRLGLARCLVVVAHWGAADAPGMPATAMASGPRLDRRVRHLIAGAFDNRRHAPWTAALVVALVFGSVVLLPVISPHAVHADSPSQNTAATSSASRPKTDADDEMPRPPVAPQPHEVPRLSGTETRPVPSLPAEAVAAPEAAPSPVVAEMPDVAPMPGTSLPPLPEGVPPVAAAPVAVPAAPAEPVPAVQLNVAPTLDAAVAAAPVAPAMATPAPPEEPAPPTPATGRSERDDGHGRDVTRQRQRESTRERAEAEARAREQIRVAEPETISVAERARDLALKAAERSRLTEAERERLRIDARNLQRQAEAERRENAERSRQLAREAAERARLSEAEREELRSRAETLRSENRERARELAERARELADKAETERRADEERRPDGIE